MKFTLSDLLSIDQSEGGLHRRKARHDVTLDREKSDRREKGRLTFSTRNLWIFTTEMGPSHTQIVLLLAAICAQVRNGF